MTLAPLPTTERPPIAGLTATGKLKQEAVRRPPSVETGNVNNIKNGVSMRKVLSRLYAVLFAVPALMIGQSGFAQNLNLPADPVTYYAEGADDSFFLVELSGVPGGYDVSNTSYPGYCIAYYDATPPVGTHPAVLYDSTGSVPSDYAESWSYINYILNHKQGTGDDVQAAIWYFTDGVDFGLTPAAEAMIDDALAFGSAFLPGAGQITAVIISALDDPTMQPIIIEVPTPNPPPAECDDFVTGGGWILTSSGAKANFGVHGGIRNGELWGGLNYIDHGTGMHVKSTATTGYVVIDATTRQISYNVTVDGVAATAIVTVIDNGEPGTRDIFDIELSTGYSAGGELGGTVKRGGGGNLQLHKAKCKGNR